MRPRRLFPFLCLLLLASIFAALPRPCIAVIGPEWLSRLATRAVEVSTTLENTCQCECCYTVGIGARRDCVSPTDTSFNLNKCSKCDVDSCSSAFPIACAQASSTVNTECIKRKGWVLLLVPVIFIGASVVLLIYGLFFKRYDGYHDDSRSAQRGPAPNEFSRTQYATFANFISDYGQKAGRNPSPDDDTERQGMVGRPSGLATISEEDEVT